MVLDSSIVRKVRDNELLLQRPRSVVSRHDLCLQPVIASVEEVRQPPGARGNLKDGAVFPVTRQQRMPRCKVPGLQNAMTSSRERTSAEAEGCRIERSLMDCVAPS